MATTSAPGRILSLDGKDYLFFGGTAYLGLPTHPAFQEILISNIRRWGTAYGSSRHSNVQLGAYAAGEQWLAEFTGAEAVMTVSSGMLAGKLVVEMLTNNTDLFFHFPSVHAAIQAPGSLPFYVNGEMNPLLQNNKPQHVTLLTDAVPVQFVEPVNLHDIEKIAAAKQVTLVVDESHSLGILGEGGQGIYSSIAWPNVKRKIMVSSLGKAMGLTGGMIASDAGFMEQLNQYDPFISAAGMSPAFVQTLADARDIMAAQHILLKENIQYLYNALKQNTHLHFHPAYPLIYLHSEKLKDALYENNIIITNFDYAGGALNRIVIAAHHTKEDLDKLKAVLNNF